MDSWRAIVVNKADGSAHPIVLVLDPIAGELVLIRVDGLTARLEARLGLGGPPTAIVQLPGEPVRFLVFVNRSCSIVWIGLDNLLHRGDTIALRTEAALRSPTDFLRNRRHDSSQSLTERERQVLYQALTGAPTKQIAATLGMSVRTAESHLARLYKKLGVSSRVELLAERAHTGFVEAATSEHGSDGVGDWAAIENIPGAVDRLLEGAAKT